MGAKDIKIGCMNGRYFVLGEDGYQPLSNFTTETEIEDRTEGLEGILYREPASFTAELELTSEAWAFFRDLLARASEVYNLVIKVTDCCLEVCGDPPNKRVMHLARHSKKLRTRKKNTRRLVRQVAEKCKGVTKE